ncbi:MAG: response regulator [Patescibacteria group bacterium]|nr:response regulator [Patescibacteria group bacterium]MDE2590698.1 response regulator [Patescibacteria group bacterium]
MLKSKTILLVDDNLDILEAVQYLLEDAGHRVIPVENGEYLESLSKENLPDLILLDMLLSGKDGGEIAYKLKHNELTKHVPIIMVSAHPSAKEAAKKSGADDFIAKPFNIEQLLGMINKYLRKN